MDSSEPSGVGARNCAAEQIASDASTEINVLDFKDLLSNVELIKGLESKRYFKASPIQALVLEKADPKRSCVIQAKAGTGKTLAFSCSTLDKFVPRIKAGVRVLVITPTHEIARQVADILRDITKFFKPVAPVVQVFIGGQNNLADRSCAQDCHIAVGTPGRLRDLISDTVLDTSAVETLILDEADRLMNSVFLPDLQCIYESLPFTTRILAASATFEARALSVLEDLFLPKDTQYFMIDGQDLNLQGICQFSLQVQLESEDKICAPHVLDYRLFQMKAVKLVEILTKVKFYQAIVFLNKQTRSSELVNKLDSMGWPSAYTSGKTKRMERLKAMAKTRSFDVRVLVCSDLIARGVDVERVDLVVNLDMPPSVDTYLHRVGRTGRFGSRGVAISLIGSDEEVNAIQVLQQTFKVPILSIDNIDQINQTTLPSRKLQREDVLAFSKLKAIRENKKGTASEILESAPRFSKRPKVSNSKHVDTSSTNSSLSYTPQSPAFCQAYPKLSEIYNSQDIGAEAALPISQYTPLYSNSFLKFWWDHFRQK